MMKLKTIALAAALPVSMLATGSSHAQLKPKPPGRVEPVKPTPPGRVGPVKPTPPGRIDPKPAPGALRTPTQLRTGGAYGEPGDQKPVWATLTDGTGAPLAGKAVTMSLALRTGTGPNAPLTIVATEPPSETDEKGTARTYLTVPDVAPAPKGSAYVLLAEFAGDAATSKATAEGSFHVQKATVFCVLDLSAHSGAPIGLQRRSDKRWLPNSETFTATVNGKEVKSIGSKLIVGLLGEGPWVVKAAYKGSDIYRPCVGERRYTNPSETRYSGPH